MLGARSVEYATASIILAKAQAGANPTEYGMMAVRSLQAAISVFEAKQGPNGRVSEEDVAIAQPDSAELLNLDRCLDRLEERDTAMARVVKLRFFAGLTVEETASALAISPRQVHRLWTGARAWLLREMQSS